MRTITIILIIVTVINTIITLMVTEGLLITAILIICMLLVYSIFSSLKHNKKRFEKQDEIIPKL